MGFMKRLKPKFWDHHDVAAGPYRHLFNFRRIWKQAVFLTLAAALLPLVLMAAVNYNVSYSGAHSEILLRTERLVSNTRRVVAFFLSERSAALDFIAGDNGLEQLSEPSRLESILWNLQTAFGGFTDIGVIDNSGRQIAYVGPYELQGVNYSNYDWYRHVLERGTYISDIFLGVRKAPHLVIAVKRERSDESYYVVRGSVTLERFDELLSQLHLSGGGDAFIINWDGVLQTPSRFYGEPLKKIPLPVPAYSPTTRVEAMVDPSGVRLVVGYAHLEHTPFILMICKQEDQLMQPWRQSQFKLLGFLVASMLLNLLVIFWVSSYLVGQIYEADQKRVATLHQVEYSNKMASIGRLAAGVAHEINNPLAIINEKAGLIKDLFTFKESYANNPKLVGLVDSILNSVERCATITRRLLNFARHLGGESKVQLLDLREVIEEVLGFLQKEALYRQIALTCRVSADVPQVRTDRGRLQQVLLNTFNNAFAAMQNGGHLDIAANLLDGNHVALSITDDGCGIPEADLKRIFEPFFSTKTNQGGTGLGLSITYSLIRELGGQVDVESTVGKGTTFTVTLPVIPEKG